MNSRPGVTATEDTAVLPGVLGCSFGFAQDRLPLRRTVQVRLGTLLRYRGTVPRWHARLRGLATAIHETSGLDILGV
jgi:hypothetical protein